MIDSDGFRGMADPACLWWVGDPTPLGRFVSVLDDGGVMAAGFVEQAEDLRAVMKVSDQDLDIVASEAGTPHELEAQVHEAVAAYFEGRFDLLARVPLSVHFLGGRGDAWTLMRALTPGTTLTMQRLMRKVPRLRNLGAAQAACDLNPAALYVPSHRIVATEESVGDYRYTLVRKEWLLAHERAAVAP